jgi:hypothetical protein
VKEGVYLFRAPHKLSVSVDHELVVVFVIPSTSSTGVVVHDPRRPLRDLRGMLDGVFEKITVGLEKGASPIFVKLFGVSNGSRAVLDPLGAWLHANGVGIQAKDLGKNVSRTLEIDCGTGAVGVRYSEAYVPELAHFLARGSARQRAGFAIWPPLHQALVLADNPITRELARQAIEEHPEWAATAPPKPLDTIGEPLTGAFPWDHVLLFEDTAGPSLVGNWIKALVKAHPEVRLYWVGSEQAAKNHKFPQNARILPPLTPETIREFKAALASTDPVDRTPPSDWHSGDILPFPRIGRK